MYSRLIDFFDAYNIISNNQYYFQKGKSTEHAIFDMQSNIVNSLEKGEFPCCIFLDFAKAFDTVNKDILLYKLNYYGIRGNTLKWLNSYLTDRKQHVQIGNILSESLPITEGVPQGSILGPLLFLIYINDIIHSSKLFKFTMFADDTCLFLSKPCLNTLEHELNSELIFVSNWLKANKLSLNVDKTKVMLFRHKHKSGEKYINLKMDGETIEEVNCTKYLGLKIDHKLLFTEHSEYIANKLKKGNYLIAKVRHFVPHKELKSFYYAHIHSHINYGSLIWGTGSHYCIDKLAKLQDKAVKLMEFSRATDADDLSELYCRNKILNLRKCLFFKNTSFIWNAINEATPCHNIINIIKNNTMLRNTEVNKYIQPYRRTDAGKQFTTCQGVKHWNSLSDKLRTTTNKTTFTKQLRAQLLSA